MTRLPVVAIIAAYNEADIIGQVVDDFIRQGVAVWLIDHASTDGTVAAVEPYLDRGVLSIERFPTGDSTTTDRYPWAALLRRKEQLATEIDAAWFVHADADEFRESPWADVSLADAIARVDALGYNAIDSARFDFWPVDDAFVPGDDVRRSFLFCEPAPPSDRVQIRCWKKQTERVDLVASGGHEAGFAGRAVFPLRFILRHYPIRGQAHGTRKVFAERRPRFLPEEIARGWHVQYDRFREGESFVRDPATLRRWDPERVRIELMLRHRGIEALEAEVAALAHQLAAAHAEAATLSARFDDADRRRRDIERSRAWRWTAPLRALFRVLSGRPR